MVETVFRPSNDISRWDRSARLICHAGKKAFEASLGRLPTESRRRLGIGLVALLSLAAVGVAALGWEYTRWAEVVDARLTAGVFHPSAQIYASSSSIPGREGPGSPWASATLVTNLSGQDRSKQRLVTYEEIPAILRHAIVSVEDHRFFEHNGVDIIRTAKAASEGLVHLQKPRGTSTLTQQLARGFFLTPERTYGRKLLETLMAWRLESRLTKQQIFEYYCNHVYMGRRGGFNIVGMGEAADAYFGKNLRELTLPEAALLAGLIQRPSYLDPYRHPKRALNRRNLVLRLMVEHGYTWQQEHDRAVREPMRLAPGDVDVTDAPHFVDLVRRELLAKFSEDQLLTGGYKVQTTLDMDLQRLAVEAVRHGMADVDRQLRNQGRFRDRSVPPAECALIALDPHTGEIKAIVGGRDYDRSQLNRVLARRQPGSAFKPFVYAAAINTAINRESEPNEPGIVNHAPALVQQPQVLTPATFVLDEPADFVWGNDLYQPSNFSQEFHGLVSLREALVQSMNVATVRVAQTVGYSEVARLARRAGVGKRVAATPSMALGAYEVTPLEMAEGYTIFANGGLKVRPYLIRSVETPEGEVLLQHEPEAEYVLDARVAYVVTNMLEDVLSVGTGRGARALGFNEPAAGKTGTDDDGWFVGFTNNLLCLVWVGFDDNTDLGIEGARSALPIWTEFMKRAHALRAYREPAPFEPPEGVVSVTIDPNTGLEATRDCPRYVAEVFIEGTQPARRCWHGAPLLNLSPRSFFSRVARFVGRAVRGR